ALPELAEMASQRQTIALSGNPADIGRDMVQGLKDVLRASSLVLRSSLIGTLVGATPGLGKDIAAWMAYGHVAQTVKEKGRIGKGDVRGVIGPEAANNASVGGALIPTLAFGVPGSAGMAVFLAALTMM